MLPHLTLTWMGALDILIVATLIYQFLVLVRGTRASQMLVGVGGLALLLFLVRRGQLPVVNWAINNFLPYAFFALIVIFQAEIRHILAKVGRNLTLGTTASEGESYDDLVMAASFFSQHQIGALVVIEREIGLRTYIESGVPMDARVSYDLMVTIFRPTAPLHDGAVIIQKDRIAAAACFLPLSMNPVLSNQVGTRHRAAIGVTEETDAIAIIVSEETGQISLAQAGHIDRNMSVEELRERLSTLLHRFVPPTTLPSPITETADPESALGKSPGVKG
jgi:diadenylate cyclase